VAHCGDGALSERGKSELHRRPFAQQVTPEGALLVFQTPPDVVTGGGGRGTRPVGHSSFTAFSEAVIHFVFVEVTGSRLVLHAIDGAGREFDQALIERSAG
jgi:hypothetical protein